LDTIFIRITLYLVYGTQKTTLFVNGQECFMSHNVKLLEHELFSGKTPI
jgi:hypothetical protein